MTWYVCGLAPGWDTALAHAAIEDDIPVTAAIPFLRPTTEWPSSDRERHNKIIARARHSFVMAYEMEGPAVAFNADKYRVESAAIIFVDGETYFEAAYPGKTFVRVK